MNTTRGGKQKKMIGQRITKGSDRRLYGNNYIFLY
jgi:hypothetical protein